MMDCDNKESAEFVEINEGKNILVPENNCMVAEARPQFQMRTSTNKGEVTRMVTELGFSKVKYLIN